MPRYRASWALHRCAPMMDGSTTYTVRPEGGVWSRVAAAPIISAPGTVPQMAPVHVGLPWLATATLVTPSSGGEASDDVTFTATGTQQYLWGSSNATSECGLTTTLPTNVVLEAINSGEWMSFSPCTPCGR